MRRAATLEAHGDRVNAAHARYLEVRRLLLIGRLDEAERALAGTRSGAAAAGVARRARTGGGGHRDAPAATAKAARAALARAERAARQAGIAALIAEVEEAARVLDTPAARLIARGEERPLRLDEVEALLASTALVVDACRHAVRATGTRRSARPAARCCSRWRARWPRPGPATCRARR